MRHRVAITGIGIVSPLGLTVEENWDRLCRRASGISRVEFQGYEAFPHCSCGGIKDFIPAASVPNKKLLKLMNRESQLAFLAAQQALDSSGILHGCARDRMGLYLGTGMTTGDLESLVPIVENSIDADGEFSYALLGTTALAKCNPLLSFRILPNMALSYISIEHTIQGPNMVFNPWPGNTVQAILEAKRSIELGDIDCALVGGCDSKCSYVSFLTLTHLGVLSHSGISKPFAPESDGMVPGEGAACVIMESFDHAEARSAAILAELCGGASGTDCSSEEIFPESSVHLEAAMQGALDNAGIGASEIDLICASAHSHPVGDRNELQAIERVFGNHDTAAAALSEFTGDLVAASAAYSLGMCAYSFGQEHHLPLAAARADTLWKNLGGGGQQRTALINAFALGTTKASMVIRNV